MGFTIDICAKNEKGGATNAIATVLAVMERDAADPEEIATRCGIELTAVEMILAFLTEFGLVESEGSRMVIAKEVRRLQQA